MRFTLALAAAALAGCHAAPVATPPPPVDPCRNVACVRPPTVIDKVDVLFVLDDAPSMGPKLAALRAALPAFVAKLDGYRDAGSAIWFHFGVVTADLGAGAAALPQFGCRPGGDGAVIQFVDDNELVGPQTGVGDALAALADVVTSGCEFRHPLEAAYRALRDNTTNRGFLRSDALLAVVFVTDGDDCSAPPATALFDDSAAADAVYGALTPFRCAQFGIACNGMSLPATMASGLTNCAPLTMADGGALIDLSRYINFFLLPAAEGGVKVDPSDVMLVGVAGPNAPVGVVTSSGPALAPSCTSPDGSLVAQPAVRIDALVGATKNHASPSICDSEA
ncbi:MAG TPA: hypothetical protein VF997_17510, partial [Polyangia bacterium]